MYKIERIRLDIWVKQSQTSGSFKEKDNRIPEEKELIKLRTLIATWNAKGKGHSLTRDRIY